MSSLFLLFAENILPIIIISAVGYMLQRAFDIDPRPLSIAIFYALTPALIFQLTINNSTSGSKNLSMVGLTTFLVLGLMLMSLAFSRLLKLSAVQTSGFLLCTMFMNAGNYGLPLNQFALGQPGMIWASIFYITHVILMYSLGVIIASAGQKPFRSALLGLLRVPALAAFILAMIFKFSQAPLPQSLMKPIDSLAAATIPAMLLVLGMQISKAGLPKKLGVVGLATAQRLVFSPLLAWLLLRFIQLPEVGARAGILEAGMPAPVLAIIISLEYNSDSDFVSAVVLLSTVLSPITLTAIMALLGL